MLDCRASYAVQWTNLELAALLEDEDSCVQFERVKKHLGLHPFHLTNLNAALREMLNTNLNFYDSELNGLVLAYKNPKLLSPLGDILYDTCFVHVDVEADFYIFKPQVARSLRGFVNKIGTNHINILVHKIFNVSVPKPTEEGEEEDESWPGHKVRIGQEVRFTVEEINFNISKLPYIRGSFNEEEYLRGCKLFNEEIAATCGSEFQDITRPNFNKISNLKIKSENKKIIFNSDSEGDDVNEIGEDQKPIISKLKDKPVTEKQPVAVASSSQELPKKRKRKSSESDNQQSDKEEKKPKVHLDNLDDTEFAIPENLPKKRKKKKALENNNHDEEDEKKQKSLINHLPEDSIPQYDDSDTSSKKKHRKKKPKSEDETDDEKKHKLTIQKLENHDSTTLEEATDTPSKKLKKRKKKLSEGADTEDEKSHKLTIIKNLDYDDANEAASESESPKSKSRKRKRSVMDADAANETEDEKNYKASLKKSLVDNTEGEFEVPRAPPKKRKKKPKAGESTDTEDERKYKKKLIKQISPLAIPEGSNEARFQAPLNNSIDDDILMDTEDERRYKSSLKVLVKNMQNGAEEPIKEERTKKKKNKKKHKSKDLESKEFDSSLTTVKEEPTDDKKSKKSLSGEKEESNLTEKDDNKKLKLEKHKET